MTLNLVETAELLGASLPMARRYVADGMSFEQKGTQRRHYVFDSARCVQCYSEKGQYPPHHSEPQDVVGVVS